MTLAISNRTKTPKPQTNTRKDKLWPLNSAKISIINCNSSNHAEGSRRKPFQKFDKYLHMQPVIFKAKFDWFLFSLF